MYVKAIVPSLVIRFNYLALVGADTEFVQFFVLVFGVQNVESRRLLLKKMKRSGSYTSAHIARLI